MSDEQVRMYSVYSDLKIEDDEVKKVKEIQYERDKRLFVKMQTSNIPLFPMDKNEFVKHLKQLKYISKEDPSLCLIFVSPEKIRVLNQEQFHVFNTIDEAYRWCQNINKDVSVNVESLKYILG